MMANSSALKFQCTFVGENGVVKGLKIFDATEQPGNRVIKYETLVKEVSSASIGDFSAELPEAFCIKCGDILVDSDEDVNRIVSNAVKYGQVNVELVVDLTQRNDWELVESASQFSVGDSSDVNKQQGAAVEAQLKPDRAENGASDKMEPDSGVTSQFSQDDITTASAAIENLEPAFEATESLEQKGSIGAENEETHEGSESSEEQSELGEELQYGETSKENTGSGVDEKSAVTEPDTRVQMNQVGEDTKEEDVDVLHREFTEAEVFKESHSMNNNNFKPLMATLGCFGTGSASDPYNGTSQAETLSEWTNPSELYKDNEATKEPDDGQLGENAASSTSYMKVMENEASDVVDAALKNVEVALEREEGGQLGKEKLTTLLSTISVIIKEMLQNHVRNDGLHGERVEFGFEDEEDASLLTRLKCLLRDREVVEAFQKLFGSTAIKEFIVDVATNDVSTVAELNNFVLNHLGDILPELGKLLRSVPQVLSVLPGAISQWSELLNAVVETPDDVNSGINSKNVHENILCDGCEQSESKKSVSKNKGNMAGAYIRGIRYKSAVKSDFDLCESCEATGEFEDEYGPFLKITSPNKAPREIVCVLPAEKTQDERGCREPPTNVEQQQSCEDPKCEEENRLVCPTQQHPLRRFRVPNRLFACDVCDSRPDKGSLMFGCRICDWDMCARCVRRNCNGRLPPDAPEDRNDTPDSVQQGQGFASRPRPYPAPRPVIRPQPHRLNRFGSTARPINADGEGNRAGNRPRAKFVADVSIPDGSVLSPGASFTKIWRVMNASETAPWPNGCRIVCVGGDMMSASPEGVLVPPVPPGEIGDICVQLRAPRKPGRCFGYWRLITPSNFNCPGGKRFGQRLWVDFTVADNEVSQAQPTEQSDGSSKEDSMLTKWAAELKQLSEMEFLDRAKNITLLEMEDGNLTKVIERLVLD